MGIRIAAHAHDCQAALKALLLTFLFVGASSSWPLLAHRSRGFTPPRPAQTAQRTFPARVTPTHFQIAVAFEPDRHFLRATAAVTLRLDAPTTSIEFELNRHLTLRSVTDPQGRSLDFVRSGRLTSHKLLVQLAEPAPASSTLTLTFAYDGSLPPAPLDYITPDGILLRDESRWYPATDFAAFTFNEFQIKTPWDAITSGNVIATWEESNGSQLAVTHTRSDRPESSRAIVAFPWEMQPCTYTTFGSPHGPLASFAVDSCFSLGRDLAAAKKKGDNLVSKPGEKIALTETLGTGTELEGKVANSVFELLTFFSGTISPPLVRKLSVVQGFPSQRGIIGYSAPGFLIVSEDVVKWHGHPGFAPEFLPHEIAHQWFPIEVTLRSEEDGWLAESLAEYLAWRYLEARQPDHARRMVERAMRNTLAAQPLRPLRLGLKLFALEDPDVTHATLYQRGMLVWRTLETVIDRERLDRALREYYARHRGGPASISDFRRICEEISGRDLAWFFDYYLNATELPAITLRRLPSAAPGELAGEIHVANAPPDFQVRVEMRITTADGVINHSVATRGPVTPFALNVPAPVTAVDLDPRLRILRVTEPARRHRAQIAALEQSSITEEPDSDPDSLRQLITVYQNAVALDPQNLAASHQLYLLQIARLQFRLKDYPAASATLDRVLALASLDPMATDFHRAWARVFRARIALARRDRAAARREIAAGLAMQSPALHSPVAWPDSPDTHTTAADALRLLLKFE
jgi:tetratricopeptide (TPR) repeat protein